jgi:hypothetical protein
MPGDEFLVRASDLSEGWTNEEEKSLNEQVTEEIKYNAGHLYNELKDHIKKPVSEYCNSFFKNIRHLINAVSSLSEKLKEESLRQKSMFRQKFRTVLILQKTIKGWDRKTAFTKPNVEYVLHHEQTDAACIVGYKLSRMKLKQNSDQLIYRVSIFSAP